MNVFEDLIGELKDENLLEETVIKTRKAGTGTVSTENFDGNLDFLTVTDRNKVTDKKIIRGKSENNLNNLTDNLAGSTNGFSTPAIPEYTEEIITLDCDFSETNAQPLNAAVLHNAGSDARQSIADAGKAEVDEKEFYRKRAIGEVSGLQMVEHILNGVEREQNKTLPAPYNDIAVKKALHDFLQISENVNSSEHAQAEFRLMHETESWCSALSHRDERIPVAHLRRYCETTKPPLSSQALISLARFYRNLPYTELIRSKFDLILTRLFSKDIGGEKRLMVFTREELKSHITELYAEWWSLSLYDAEEEDAKVFSAVSKLEEFITEAERSENFDELINSDFFNRLRNFKDGMDEVFFAPLVTATTIESNVRIGNRYVDLIEIERQKSGFEALQEKIDFLNEQSISDSTSKTLQLIELLQEIEENPIVEKPKKTPRETVSKTVAPVKETKARRAANSGKNVERKKYEFLAVNKWLLSATVITIVLSFGLYFWVNYGTDKPNISTNVKDVNLENSIVKDYVQTARISGDTFYGVTSPGWDNLSQEKREELIKKIFSSGKDKGFAKVHLLNNEGKAVGYANTEKTEVLPQ